MNTLTDQIAAALEKAFSQNGFAEVSVAQLKDACQVSLRTLYKYYPSKEAMIVAALTHRHQRYLQFLLSDLPTIHQDAMLMILDRLELWMKDNAPHGCLSMNALAAFPDNDDVVTAVKQHKSDIRESFIQLFQLDNQISKDNYERLANTLFLLHEGLSSAWPVFGQQATNTAKQAVIQLSDI